MFRVSDSSPFVDRPDLNDEWQRVEYIDARRESNGSGVGALARIREAAMAPLLAIFALQI